MVLEGPEFSLYPRTTHHSGGYGGGIEDRCAPRARIAVPATLRLSGSRSFQTVVRDLSIAGFAASSINRINPGTVCWLTMPGLESLQAEAVWWNNSVVGCAFANLLGQIVLDSMVRRWPANSMFRTIT